MSDTRNQEAFRGAFAPNWILRVVFETFSSEPLQIETPLISVTLVFQTPQSATAWSRLAPEVRSEAAVSVRLATCPEINRGGIYKAAGSRPAPLSSPHHAPACVRACLWVIVRGGYVRLIPRSRISGLVRLENKLTLLTLINLEPLLLALPVQPTQQTEAELRRLSRPHFHSGADLNLNVLGLWWHHRGGVKYIRMRKYQAEKFIYI